jgi:CheY-like chemotaxis protein
MRAIRPHEKFSLLIVHGDDKLRRQFEAVAAATDHFWSIRCMADGRFALEYLWTCVEKNDTDMPDILITDLSVDGLNGIQLTREIRRFEELREIFVALIASTGGALEQDAAESAGCDFFLRQPRTPAELAEVFHAIANRCALKASVPQRLIS